MTEQPCDYCDTMGPFVRDEQPVRDLHRAWHELGRAWQRAFGPLLDAFAQVTSTAQAAKAASYALAPPTDTEDPMTTPAPPLEVWRVEPHDDVTLIHGNGIIAGRVTRVTAHPTKGTALYLYGRGLPYWVGPRPECWRLHEHKPAIPPVLRAGARYHVMTSDDRNFQAYWSPIDGIRANHPWLHPDGQTRTRQDLVVRARLADTEGSEIS